MPDFARMVFKDKLCQGWEVLSFAVMVGVERRRLRCIMVKAFVYLVPLDLVQQFGQSMISDHDGGRNALRQILQQ